MKKLVAYTLAILLFGGISSIPVNAMETTKDLQDNEDKITERIESINDSSKQEKITDLLELEYLEVELTDERNLITDPNQPEIVYESSDAIIKDIDYLSKLNKKTLDNEVEDRIESIVNKARNNSNIILLPSSYNVLKKYNYNEIAANVQKENNVARISSVGLEIPSNEIISKAASTGYEKSASGYIRNGSGAIVAAYKMTVQWFTNKSNRIYYWDIYNKSSAKSNYYTHISHASEYARKEDGGKVLEIERTSKFRKVRPVPGLATTYNTIWIHAECFTTGKIDSWYDTIGSYK